MRGERAGRSTPTTPRQRAHQDFKSGFALLAAPSGIFTLLRHLFRRQSFGGDFWVLSPLFVTEAEPLRKVKLCSGLSEMESRSDRCPWIIPQSCRNTELFTPGDPSESTQACKNRVACQAVFIERPPGRNVLIPGKTKGEKKKNHT